MNKPRTFVMGDIHGMYKALKQCLERSNFNKEVDTLIHLGDVADRGPELFECVEELLSIKNLVAIKGNHDAWFKEWIKTGNHPGFSQGGKASIASYTKHCDVNQNYTNMCPLSLPQAHVDFFTNQLYWYKDKDANIYVHGGFNRHQLLEEHPSSMVFWWDRDLWHTAMSYEAMNKGLVYHESGGNVTTFKIKEPCKEVFIGHTPTLLWSKDVPMKAANINNLDTGAGMGGKLTIMDIDSKQFWQSDYVNELYPPYATFETR